MPPPLLPVSSPAVPTDILPAPKLPAAPSYTRPPGETTEGTSPPRLRPAVTPGAIIAALRRKWRVAAVAGLVAAAACAVAVWTLRPDKYTASAVLRIAQSEQRVLQDGARSPEGDTYTRSQIVLLRSRPVLLAALRDERVAQLPFVQKAADPAAVLEKALSVDPVPGTDLLRVTLTVRDSGADLAPVVNAVIDAYLAAAVRGDQSDQAAHLKSLQVAYDGSEEKLRQLRESYQRLTRTLKGGDNKILARRQQVLVDEYAALKRELGTANSRDRDLEVKIAARRPSVAWVTCPLPMMWLSVPTVVAPAGAAEPVAAADPRVLLLEKEAARCREQLNRFDAVSADPNSSARADYVAHLAAAEAAVRAAREEEQVKAQARQSAADIAAAAGVVREAGAERAALQQQRGALQAEVNRLREELDNFGVDSADLEMKRAEIERNEGFLRAIWEQRERMDVEQKGSRQRVTVVAKAEDATVSNKYGRLQEAGGAGVAALAVVLFAVAFVDLRRNHIHTPTDVSRGLRLRVLCALPTLPEATVEQSESATYGQFEAIDDLRTTLLTGPAAGRGEGGRVLLIASAVPGEGKSTLATQLAASFARVGRRTLLVDGDLRSPSLHHRFGMDGGPGVCEVLGGTARAEEAIRPTWMLDLDLLPVGVLDSSAEAALARPAVIRRVFDDLRTRYDFVIVDTSPILLVSDALMISECVDGLLLSVRPGVSKADEVYTAYERLSELHLPVLGVVVNGVSPRAAYSSPKSRPDAAVARG